MNRKLFVLLVVVAMLLPAASVSAAPVATAPAAAPPAAAELPADLVQEMVVPVAADTYVSAYNPTMNFAGKANLYVRSGGIEQALLKFDLSSIPTTATVLDAQLTLYLDPYAGPPPSHPFQLSAYQVMRAWNAMEATWLNATATDMWGLPGLGDTASDRAATAEFMATYPQESTAKGITGAADVFIPMMAQAWVSNPAMNDGVVLTIDATKSMAVAIASSDHWDAALHPSLKVIYTTYEVGASGVEYIQDSEDTYINEWEPDANYDGKTRMKVRTGGEFDSLVKFPLGGVAAAEIPSDAIIAKAYLWVYEAPELGRVMPVNFDTIFIPSMYYGLRNPYQLEAFMASMDWSASTATWNFPWAMPGADAGAMLDSTMVTQPMGWVQLDVTEAAQMWMNGMAASADNFGLTLKASGIQSAEYAYLTQESSDPMFRPKLAVYWLQKPAEITLNFVDTNDFHGALVGATHSYSHGDVVGGLAWIAGYYDILNEINPGGVVPLDAGDMMQGTLDSNYFDGASTVAGMNALGLRASTFGNHEFDWGIDILEERIAQANFPWISCNIRYKENGERPSWATPYAFIEANGIKIGVVGASLPETPTITNPTYTGNLDFTDPAVEINALLDEVWGQGANAVVVVAHVGGFSPDYGEAGVLASELDPAKVQLLVTGHTHSNISTVINGIPVVQAYSSGTAFGRVDYTFDPWTKAPTGFEMKGVLTTYDTMYGEPVIYEGHELVPDAAVQAAIQPYLDEVEELKNSVIGETLVPLTRDSQYESSMGDFVTDAMRAYDDTVDFAMTNSGGLRADLDAGPITFGALFNVLPFGNTLTKVWLTADQIRATLEDGVSGRHGIVQESGLQFTFDYDQPIGSRIVGDIIDLRTGLPLDETETYIVVVNNFMAAGGDEYATLPLAPQEDTYAVDIDYMVSYVEAHSPISEPVGGRMIALGTP